jgi:hypothetical protein
LCLIFYYGQIELNFSILLWRITLCLIRSFFLYFVAQFIREE